MLPRYQISFCSRRRIAELTEGTLASAVRHVRPGSTIAPRQYQTGYAVTPALVLQYQSSSDASRRRLSCYAYTGTGGYWWVLA
eukprot:3825097-Rhodomonas_salina.1